jgi:tetratricopeptide (TPR) repeat protein
VTSRSPVVGMALVLAGVIAVMALGDLGGGVLNEVLLYLPGVDKVLHALFSFAIFFALHSVLRRTPVSARTALLLAAAGATTTAAFDELQQELMANRSVEVLDVLAGLSGVLIAVAWQDSSRRPRRAAVLAATGLVAAGVLTHMSYRQTRDYNAGLLAERRGQRSEALEHYRAAVAAGVRNAEAYNALAWTMVDMEEGDPREAVKYAEQSLAMRPGNADTLDTYGWALHLAGRSADAVEPLEQALAAKPDIYCIHYHLAMVYLAVGRRDDGLQHLRQQITEKPRTMEARRSADVLARLTDSEGVR